MSNLFIACIAISFFASVWSVAVIWRQGRRIHVLERVRQETQALADRLREERDDYAAELHGKGKHTTAEWREIAFHHARVDKGRDKKMQWVEESNAWLLHENQAWSEQFRHLVIFIWGDPPLDRSVKDVCDFISNLRVGITVTNKKAETLTLAYVILGDKLRETEARLKSASAEVQARNRELAATEGALRRNLEALCRVTTNQESLRRFQEDREAFMREIEGLTREEDTQAGEHQCEWVADALGSRCKVCGVACPF